MPASTLSQRLRHARLMMVGFMLPYSLVITLYGVVIYLCIASGKINILIALPLGVILTILPTFMMYDYLSLRRVIVRGLAPRWEALANKVATIEKLEEELDALSTLAHQAAGFPDLIPLEVQEHVAIEKEKVRTELQRSRTVFQIDLVVFQAALRGRFLSYQGCIPTQWHHAARNV